MKKYTNTEPSFSEEIPILETSDSNHADNFNKAFKPLLENTLVNYKNIAELKELMDALKKSVSDGKSAVASAITSHLGISTASDASFEQMANNISSYKPQFTSIRLLDVGQYVLGSDDKIHYDDDDASNVIRVGELVKLESGENISGSIVWGFNEVVGYGGTKNITEDWADCAILVNLSVSKNTSFQFNIDIHDVPDNAIAYLLLINKEEYDTFRQSYDVNCYLTGCSVQGISWNDREMNADNGSFVGKFSATLQQGEYIFLVTLSNMGGFSVKNKMSILLY